MQDTQSTPEHLSFEEAAQQLGITYKMFCKLVKLFPEIHEKFVTKAVKGGRRRFVISRGGLSALAMVRESNGKVELNETIRETKQNFAISVVEHEEMIKGDPILQQLTVLTNVRKEQLKMAERIETAEERIKVLEDRFEVNGLTPGQRARLNERVRYFCHETRIAHNVVWSLLHQSVARKKIDEYKFEDYAKAMNTLDGLFKQSHLNPVR